MLNEVLGMIKNIQILRAVAAILVVVCHSTGQWGDNYPWLTHYGFACGFAGVDLFFVISGFIITSVAAKGLVKDRVGAAISRFAFNRVTRIYPIYWIALLVASLLAIYTTGSLVENRDGLSFLGLSTLTQTSPVLGVAWTLQFELFFYLIVAAVMLLGAGRFKRNVLIALAAYSVLIIAWQIGGGKKWFFTNPIILDFLFGVLVFIAVDAGKVRAARAATVLGAIGLAFGTYLMMEQAWGHYVERPFYLGAPAALLLYGMIGIEKRWQAPKLAVLLGDASYSIYLWHGVILHPVRILDFRPYPSLMAGFVVIVSMVLVGVASYQYIEKPIARAIARTTRKQAAIALAN